MDRVYVIDDGPTAETRAPQPMQVSWTIRGDEPIGVFTDKFNPRSAAGDPTELDYLGHVGSLIKCFADDRVAALAGTDPRQADRVTEKLAPSAWGDDVISVDDAPVRVATVPLYGLEFAAGAEPLRHPFVVIRRLGVCRDWPPLRSIPEAARR